jgi:arylsulfatase
MGWLSELDAGYPGYRGDLTRESATLAEVLGEQGWSTFHVGKWHVNYVGSNGPCGPFHNWPTNRGFERAYWYTGHATDCFRPGELMDGLLSVVPPPTDDYYINDDLADRAISYLKTARLLSPDKPFYLHLCFPTSHAPLQVRPRERDAYKGAYDVGWDEVRAARLKRQKAIGVAAETTELPPLSPGAQAWETLSPLQKKVYARYMEVYAAMITNVDANIGRVLTALDELGVSENTVVVILSDHGASAEGTPTGTPNLFAPAFGRAVPLEQVAELYDVMGEEATYPHYPQGWANVSNTPYRLYKQFTHLGGVADPLIIAWPKLTMARGEVRKQFVHVIDIYPTLLEAAGVKRPDVFRGQRIKPLEGASILKTLTVADAPTRTEQYFELGGHRAYLDGDWRIVTRHARGKPFDRDVWELYNLSKDPNELHDLAAEQPERVNAMVAKWNQAAQRYGVFPLDDRDFITKLVQDRQARGIRAHWELVPPIERLGREVAPLVCGFSHEIEIDCVREGNGVLLAHGSRHAGYVLYVKDDKLFYEQSLIPWVERIAGPDVLPKGPIKLKYVQTMRSRPFDGDGALFVNGSRVATHRFERVLFATGYDGFSVGEDLGSQVSTAYRGTNPFQGRVRKVTINVDNSRPGPLEALRFLNFIKRMGIEM